MKFRTHIVFTSLMFLIFWGLFEKLDVEKLTFFVFFLFGGLFPDIDTRNSKIGKYLPLGWFTKHRGYFHSILLAAPLSLTIEFFLMGYGLAFFSGYLSHLILDMLNHKGIAIFYPLSKQRIRGPLKTSGIFEEILFLFLTIALITKIFLI